MSDNGYDNDSDGNLEIKPTRRFLEVCKLLIPVTALDATNYKQTANIIRECHALYSF